MNNYKTGHLLIVLIQLIGILALSSEARAHHSTNSFVLDLHNSHFRGDSTLYLKRELKRQYPHIKLKHYEIEKVKLIAKSKHGYGSVVLRVGDNYSYAKEIDGRPHRFYSDRYSSFDKIRLKNPSYNSKGPWQLLLQGNIKVDKIKIKLRKKKPRSYYHSRHSKRQAKHHSY